VADTEYFTDTNNAAPIVNMPSGRVFNFADNEENYFAVMEKSKELSLFERKGTYR
jgi:hypothetical protein